MTTHAPTPGAFALALIAAAIATCAESASADPITDLRDCIRIPTHIVPPEGLPFGTAEPEPAAGQLVELCIEEIDGTRHCELVAGSPRVVYRPTAGIAFHVLARLEGDSEWSGGARCWLSTLPEDIDGDGVVQVSDMLLLMDAFQEVAQ